MRNVSEIDIKHKGQKTNYSSVARIPVNQWNSQMWLAAIVLASACFQNVFLLTFSTFALKLYHVVTVFVLLYTFVKRRSSWKLTAPLFFVGLLCILTISLIDYMKYGFNSVILNYIFMYLIAACIYNLGRDFDLAAWKSIVQIVSMIVMLAVYVKLVINWDAEQRFLNNSWAGHPVIPCFLGGGVNLESTWLALFIVFFDDDRRGKLYLALSIVLSILYASRAGLITSVLALAYVYVLKKGKRGLSTRMIVSIFLLAVFLAILAANGVVVAERLLAVGDDRGSEGRLNIWQHAGQTFFDAPFLGNGAGNAIQHINILNGSKQTASFNVHMYPLQVLLDFGVIGFAIFLAMVLYFLWRCCLSRLSSPFEAYVLIYLIISLIQFRGGDVLLGFALAGLFAEWEGRKCLARKV